MKTKLTLLLALALSAPAFADKPNFNGVKPTIKAPVVRSAPIVRQAPPVRSAPSVPSNRVSPSANVGQIIGIARSVMPFVTNAPQYQPRQAPPPPRAVPSQKVTNPAVITNKPATRNSGVAKPGALNRHAPAGIRSNVPSAVSGMNPNLAPALAASHEIANGLQSLESMRNSLGTFREFDDMFQPGNSGTRGGGGLFAPFNGGSGPDGNTEVHNPLNPSTSRPRDIRAGISKTRHSDGSTGLSRTGDSVLESEVSTASGRDGTHTPVESTTEENGDITASTTTTTSDGSTTTNVEVTEHADGSGTTTRTHGSDGRNDTITMTRRDSSGAVSWSRTETVYPGGKSITETRDSNGRVTGHTTEYYTPRPRSRGPHPDDNVSSGPPAPRVNVNGLLPIDLLRQFANGERNSGGTNFMTRPNRGVEVNPGNPNNNPDGPPGSGGSAKRIIKDLFDTISNPGPHGGEGPVLRGNPGE
jgi:hypothetical protein